MRLKCIKLSGFKSFVDATTIPFPTNMTAVVGPNGCGKSNTIDAIRWVMGESSAKHLRGESMTDVIFNGSNHRKPVGQCSVELIFDNKSGTAPGVYASYAEISVRRKVTREAQSYYYLNGTKCRRKDITDLFLGTGLGPRSYAIIEQGMISRLIESKPEELRVYIEEAAGISKYKERRKETESRMRRTHENLERLSDIRDELERQIAHLQRQAQSAERFTEFKKEERQKKAQLQAIKWKNLELEVNQKSAQIAELEAELERYIAEQVAIDARIETFREENNDAIEEFNVVQGQFYQLGNEIARFEQELEHQKEKANKNQLELLEADRELMEARREYDDDVVNLELLREEHEILAPDIEIVREQEQETLIQVADLEQEFHTWQLKWDEFNQGAAGPRQTAEVSQSKIRHSEQVIDRTQRRLQTLFHERDEMASDPESELVSELLMETESLEAQIESSQVRFEEQTEQLEIAREQQEQKRQKFHDLQQKRTQFEGKKATLEALQKAALGDSGDGVQHWLESNQLQHQEKLATQIQVEDGWNQAVETVMGNYLQAICISDISALTNSLQRFDEGVLNLFETRSGTPAHPDMLLSKVTAPVDLSSVLANVKVAADLATAMTIRKSLNDSESVVTPDGIWMGKNWLRVSKDTQGSTGYLSRQTELESIDFQLDEFEFELEELEVDTDVQNMRVQSLHQDRELAQQELTRINRSYTEFKAQLSGKQAQVEQMRQRKNQLMTELEEQQSLLEDEKENISDARIELQEALDAMEEGVEEREQLQEQRESLRIELDNSREQARVMKDQVHQWVVKEQTLNSKIEAISHAMERLHAQVKRLDERKTQLMEAGHELKDPDDALQIELEQKLEDRLILEQKLADARGKREHIDTEMRDLDSQRHRAESKATIVRDKTQQARMESQAVLTRRDTIQEQLAEDQYDLTTLVQNLPDDANDRDWEVAVQQLEAKISRLGPINLAAIDEYKAQSERKVYLDAQNEDLEKALNTLEKAIAKIDKETRNRFQETFEKVNSGLQDLFPRVFGGGHAYLELTGEDLLNTGVTIMARPPGKKNSTIHLLSGGEKALTAIALVFSIFKLNPAPFCLLDEVDAPLDDANVSRYARLVDAMSEHVQFIYITHNKIAMEMAKDLMGVTMNEPGVSRLVSVNVEEAAELAAV